MWFSAALFILVLGDVRVIDGDTIAAGGERYRIAGIDAPEIGHARCPQERALGEAAAARARELIAAASHVEAQREGRVWPRDRYRRRVATIMLDGADLGDTLMAEGLALPWNGQAPKPGFC